MGQTLKNLAKRDIDNKSVFNSRFVVEVAEKMHVHYRNLRLILSVADFKEMATGFAKSLERWSKIGRPEPKERTHIELCRKKVSGSHNDGIQVNLNRNLYNLNKGKIFADGAEFTDDAYIHLKIRDTRIEMSIEEFNVLADAVKEAKGKLNEVK